MEERWLQDRLLAALIHAAPAPVPPHMPPFEATTTGQEGAAEHSPIATLEPADTCATNGKASTTPAQTQSRSQLQQDERSLLEMQHVGLLDPDTCIDVNELEDDEIAIQIRRLQEQVAGCTQKNNRRRAQLRDALLPQVLREEQALLTDDKAVERRYQKLLQRQQRRLAKAHGAAGHLR